MPWVDHFKTPVSDAIWVTERQTGRSIFLSVAFRRAYSDRKWGGSKGIFYHFFSAGGFSSVSFWYKLKQ